MAKQIVGLKIGASQLAAACLEVNGSAKLVQIAQVKSDEDTQGEQIVLPGCYSNHGTR